MLMTRPKYHPNSVSLHNVCWQKCDANYLQ